MSFEEFQFIFDIFIPVFNTFTWSIKELIMKLIVFYYFPAIQYLYYPRNTTKFINNFSFRWRNISKNSSSI